MNNLNKLFEKYYRILNEQEPQAGDSPTATDDQQQVVDEPVDQDNQQPPEPEIMVTPGEKYIINILVSAFCFDKSKLTKPQLIEVRNLTSKINNLKGSSITTSIDLIKQILKLQPNTVVREFKTLNLIKRHILIIDQSLDATDLNTSQPTNTADQSPEITDNRPEVGELELARLWPQYSDLIISAIEHIPTVSDFLILRPSINKFIEEDPLELVTVIKDLLTFRSSEVTDKQDKLPDPDIDSPISDLPLDSL